MLLINTYI